MAWAICGRCGGMTHKSLGDPSAYEAQHPELLTLVVAIATCTTCDEVAALGKGARVRVRKQIAERRVDRRGQLGHIERTARGAAGHVLAVVLDDDEHELFSRDRARARVISGRAASR